MNTCMYPECTKRAKFGCVCHLGDGWFCKDHIDNHIEATKQKKGTVKP